MLAPWLELPAFASVIDQMSAACGTDLRRHGVESDADTIRDTAIAQPLIVASGLATAAASASLGLPLTASDFVAGHSVGEITAAALAGVLTLEGAAHLVATRGEQMAHAANSVSTTMAAVLGGERDEVVAELEARNIVPANQNGANQIVAAGTVQQIEELIANPPAGTKVRQLQVAGAFHTHFMASAQAAVAEVAATLAINTPVTTLISNQGGDIVTDGNDFVARLVSQVAAPVRWDLCMQTMVAGKVTGLIELFPGGTLTGIAKRAMPGVELLAIKSVDDLALVPDFVAKHQGVESVSS
jgi:[acyl-carrier-protein] S-malonyltransferase